MSLELDKIYLNSEMEKLQPHEIILETRAKVDIEEVGFYYLLVSCIHCIMIKIDPEATSYFESTLILKGEEITIHYSGGLKGRLMRRRLMKEGWFFDCNCDRCMSGTELGSHMSSLICNSCTEQTFKGIANN